MNNKNLIGIKYHLFHIILFIYLFNSIYHTSCLLFNYPAAYDTFKYYSTVLYHINLQSINGVSYIICILK